MIQSTKIRDLFFSAASGLVQYKDHFYVVADDELQLGVFPLVAEKSGFLYPILSGELPVDHQARKKVKPDFEALVILSNKLLALPSGSTENRQTGVAIQLTENGLSELKSVIDFSPLYSFLSKEFTELNIEGATVSGNQLKLFQRGNGSSGVNAVIDLTLTKVLSDMAIGKITSDSVEKITPYDLGTLQNVRLSFTDASALADYIVFVAAAEDTNDTYNDAPCVGSVVGMIDQRGKIIYQQEIIPSVKAEGVCAQMKDGRIQVFFVTDADDPSKKAALYSCLIKPLF